MTAVQRLLPFGRYDLRMALFVTRREVRDALRDWRIIIPIIILTLVFPALATFTARGLFGFTAQYGATLIGDRLVPFLLLIVGFFPMSFSLVIALETFVGEKERKSLEPLLATPLTNTQLYVGKMLAALIPPMVTSYLGIAVYILGLFIFADWAVPPTLLAQILLLSTVQGVIMVAAAVIVSSQTTSARAANLLASFIIVPVALLLQFEAVALFWGNNEGLWWLLTALIVTAIMLIRMGIKIFNREELLGQDIDQLRLGWMWRQFAGRFRGRGVDGSRPNPIRWFRQLLGLLPEISQPALILLFALAGGLAFGFYLSGRYGTPAGSALDITADGIAANASQLQLLSGQLPRIIFMQNVRVILITAVLGIFTFGVTDVIIFMLPWALLGFLAGQLASGGASAVQFFVAAVLPHALFEVPALLIAYGALLRWHGSILARPQSGTVGQTWLRSAADFGRLFIGLVVPLLILAAFVEATITPKVILLVYGN